MLRKYTPKYTNIFRFFVSTHASPFLTYQFLLGVLLSCIYIFANNNVAFAIKRLQCPNQCGNSLDNMTTTPGVKRGVCVDGLCHCYTGFSGVDCSEGHGPKNRHTFLIHAIDQFAMDYDHVSNYYSSLYHVNVLNHQ